MKKFLTRDILSALAARHDFKVEFVDDFGYCGFVQFSDGRRSFFKGASFDINDHAASIIADDKDYCARFLRRFGYSTPQGLLVFSDRYREPYRRDRPDVYATLPSLDQARVFAAETGYPVYVKPNDASEGVGVSKVYDEAQLQEAVQDLFSWTDSVLVQRPARGQDFRVVVAGGEVFCAYRRSPLAVTGDGRRSLGLLVEDRFASPAGGTPVAKVDRDDPRIGRELAQSGYGLADIVPPGRTLPLLPNANLSSGGVAEDVTATVHESYRTLCVAIARDMNLKLCGIDILAESLAEPVTDYTVLELNSSPGLGHFAALGAESLRRTEAIFEAIVLGLKRAAG